MELSVYDEIKAEREYQDRKFGIEFDDKNTVNDWGTYINVYVADATSMSATESDIRKALLKVASLAVSAVQTFDRNKGFAPRHYDEVA